MKILIAYDGSECSDAAVIDLRRAGLPKDAEVTIFSVADVPQQAYTVPHGAILAGSSIYCSEELEQEISTTHQLQDAQSNADQAAKRLHDDFPGWQIKTEAWIDSAGSAIVRKAYGWHPDLIVVGSHGRSGIGRLVLGSVSQHVLNHVDCSVRISRHHLHSQERAIRLLIGVDGSNGAKATVQAVAARNWPAGTEVRVVGVLDSRIPVAAATCLEGAIPAAVEEEARIRMSKAVHEAAAGLTKSGLIVTDSVLVGRPANALLEEAEKWDADCVFVGARGLNGFERMLLGSVSTAVASRAHCSVEVVRPKPK
jgi:nucleotide-binding universal stress UspA family protein